MSELKKLSTAKPAQKVSSGDGFRFGLGFWLAGAVVSLVVVPAFLCAGTIALSLLGQIVQDLLSNL